jgi:hypothetical protein
MAILNDSSCKGHAWFLSCRLCWRAPSVQCCKRLRRRKFGLWRAVLGHVLHNVLGRKIYPTLLRPRPFIHNSFSMISSRPEVLPKSPRPRLSKPESASNILLQSFDFRKKTLLHMVRRAHSSCAPNSIDLKFLVWPGLIFDLFYHCCQA